MTGVGLVQALSAYVRDVVKDYRLESDGGGEKSVTVYEQIIPEEVFDREDRDQYHPLIGVTLSTLEDDERAEATVDLTIGTYSEDADGWRDLLNLTDCVRRRLLQKQLLERRYRLIKPLTVEILERQPVPFFYGFMTARYMMYQPEEERRMRNA